MRKYEGHKLGVMDWRCFVDQSGLTDEEMRKWGAESVIEEG